MTNGKRFASITITLCDDPSAKLTIGSLITITLTKNTITLLHTDLRPNHKKFHQSENHRKLNVSQMPQKETLVLLSVAVFLTICFKMKHWTEYIDFIFFCFLTTNRNNIYAVKQIFLLIELSVTWFIGTMKIVLTERCAFYPRD